MRVLDVAGARELEPLTGHTAAIYALPPQADNQALYTISRDLTVRRWTVGREGEVSRTNGPTEADVTSCGLSANGKLAAWGLKGGTVAVWDAAAGKEQTVLRGHSGDVHRIAFTPDGLHVATAGADGTFELWEVAGGKKVRDVPIGNPGFEEPGLVALSPDGKAYAAAAGTSLKADSLADAPSGPAPPPPANHVEAIFVMPHANKVSSVAVSPDGTLAASGDWDQAIRLWDLKTGKSAGELTWARRRFGGNVNGLHFFQRGERLLSATQDGMWLWDVPGKKELLASEAGLAWIGMTASPDGSQAVGPNGDGVTRVWDAKTGRVSRPLGGELRSVRPSAFTADGKRVLSGEPSTNVLIWWEVANAKVIRTIPTGHNAFACVAVSPDGKRGVSAEMISPPKL